MTWPVFLHIKIARCTLDNIDIDKMLNIHAGFPFENWYRNFQKSNFCTICESWLFEITPFQVQNVFISKAKLKLNLKLALHLHDTPRYWPKCQKLTHLPMQIHMNFEIEGMCIRQNLPYIVGSAVAQW